MSSSIIVPLQIEEGGDENSYEVLRKAVKEYWTTTKEYYKAVRYSFYLNSSAALGNCA